MIYMPLLPVMFGFSSFVSWKYQMIYHTLFWHEEGSFTTRSVFLIMAPSKDPVSDFLMKKTNFALRNFPFLDQISYHITMPYLLSLGQCWSLFLQKNESLKTKLGVGYRSLLKFLTPKRCHMHSEAVILNNFENKCLSTKRKHSER